MWGGLEQDIGYGGGGGGGHLAPIPHPPNQWLPSGSRESGCGNAGSRREETREMPRRERRSRDGERNLPRSGGVVRVFSLADGDTAFQWHFGFVRHSLMTGQSLNEF